MYTRDVFLLYSQALSNMSLMSLQNYGRESRGRREESGVGGRREEEGGRRREGGEGEGRRVVHVV